MEVAFESCPAVATPSESIRRQLEASGDAYDVEQIYSCELPVNHIGPHYSIGQGLEPDAAEVDDVWLRWSDADDLILESKPMCPAVHADGDECEGEGICMLYEAHPGTAHRRVRFRVARLRGLGENSAVDLSHLAVQYE